MLLRGSLFFVIFLKICVTFAKKSSVTFVIDDTLSMWDDINQVRAAAGEIMNIVTREKAAEIKNIVLVTFNDPGVLLRTKTTNKKEYIDALNQIIVHSENNRDCPEYALAGIERALQESEPGSYLFVFTDATAKDYYRVNEIKNLCEKKQSQVIFVLTGDCSGLHRKGYAVYHEIAKASAGQVFRISKNNVKHILDAIKVIIKDKNTVVTSVVVPPRFFGYAPVPFTVDEKTEYVLISTSGKNVDLVVKDKPAGGRSLYTEHILWQQSAKMVKFDAPTPGTYYACVKGDTDISIVVYARTDFKFDHGFSEFVPKSLADTSKLPIADRNHYLSISVNDPDHTVDIQSVEILDMNEKVQTTLPLSKANSEFYITSAFVSPSSMFKIQVTGKAIKTGKQIKRISKTAIEPQIPPKPVPKAPEVKISEGSKTEVDYYGDITLTCKVSGYPAPDIVWISADGTVLSQKSYAVELPYEYISYLKLSKVKNPRTYHCKATNEQGIDSSELIISPRSPFLVKTPLAGTTPSKYGEEKKLLCDVSSLYPMEIKWKTPLKPSEYSLSADNKELTIKSVNIEAQGKYSCEAKLISDPQQKHDVETNIVISDLAPPTIHDATISKITVSYGEKIHIWCKFNGIPRPSISWQIMRNAVFEDLSVSGEQLFVDNAGLTDAGQYRCIAKNDRGQIDKITEVVVQKVPNVVIEEGSEKSVTYGNDVILTCKIVAYPLPEIKWTDSRRVKMFTEDHIISSNNITSLLKLRNIKASGTYFCSAKNNLGKYSSKIDITVPSPIIITSHPKDKINSKYGEVTNITCDMNSTLPLKLKWFYQRGASVKAEIYTSGKYKISPTGTTLHILSTDLNNIGKYTCEASLVNDENQKVAFTADVEITNISPPTLQNTDPQKLTVQYNDHVRIPCKIVGGIPPPFVSWQVMKKGDNKFEDLFVTGQELIVDNATLENAGQYRCIAKNAKGQTEKTTELIVQKAPEIFIDEGEAATVAYRSTNEFNCRIVAHPLPTNVWKDSKGIELKSTNTFRNNEVTSRLEVKNIKASDVFSCYTENDLGKNVTSVKVTVMPPIVIPTPSSGTIEVNYKMPSDILCAAKSAFPIKVKWFYQNNDTSNKSQIHTSDKYTISADGRALHIISTDLDLVGKYICEASLIADENEKTSLTTKVEINNLKAPEITVSDKSITVMNGQSMSASCKASGIPKPTITWQFKSINSTIFTSTTTLGEQITIPNISYESAGSYRCTAENKISTNSSIIDVIVHGKSNITNIDTVYTGVTGDKILKVPCEVTGVPEPTIIWKYNGHIVTSDAKISVARNTLFIKNPTENDSKKYTCEAKNQYGSVIKKFEATITDFIDINETSNNYYYLKVGQSADIKCLLPFSDPQSIRWYVNGKSYGVLGSSYSIKNAIFAIDGNYTCRLNTDQGSESLNYVVDVGYEPTFSTTPMLTIEWNTGVVSELDCSVRAKPREMVEWTYKGNPLDSQEIILPIVGFGTYTCNVSNPHGSVQRTFNVTSDGCFIDRTVDIVQNMPLMVDDKTMTWPRFEPQYDEYIIVRRKEIITLQCSTQDQTNNTFTSHPNANKLEAECYNEDNFIVNGKMYKFKDLQCKERVRSSQVVTRKPCMKNKGKIIGIGFKLKNGFLGVYDVCYSAIDHRTLYTKVLMSDVDFGNIVKPSFMLNEGNETSNIGGEITKCQYNQRRMVSPVNVAFGPAQVATLSDRYNTVPVYEPCEGSSRMSWREIEIVIESALFDIYTMTVWTGASHYDSNGIPRYLWKVVELDDDEKYQIIVYVNAPNPDSNDIVCAKIPLERFSDITDTKDQYTYSCSIEDFSNAFNVPLSDFGIHTTPLMVKH